MILFTIQRYFRSLINKDVTLTIYVCHCKLFINYKYAMPKIIKNWRITANKYLKYLENWIVYVRVDKVGT